MADANLPQRGRWQAVRELGRGGQGTAYLAVNTDVGGGLFDLFDRMSKQVAREQKTQSEIRMSFLAASADYRYPERGKETFGVLKILNPMTGTDADLQKAYTRISQEIACMKNLTHPNLLRLLDADESDRWFVSEYFDRGTLANNLDIFRGKPVEALRALRGLVNGVSAVHYANKIHRDIKPQNIFVRSETEIVLGDFGLVYYSDVQGSRVTDSLESVGTHGWMPPWAEHRLLADVKPSFDVYGLGKVLWAMVSGESVLPREYWREPQFNVERKFQHTPFIFWINRFLGHSIQEKEADVVDSASQLEELIDIALNAITRRGEGRLDGEGKEVPNRCPICGMGFLILAEGDLGGVEHRTERYDAPIRLRFYECKTCGTIQLRR